MATKKKEKETKDTVKKITATKKKTVTKKVEPKKTTVSNKTTASKKTTAKKVEQKKASPVKKASTKKTTTKKAELKKTEAVKKTSEKEASTKKAEPKKTTAVKITTPKKVLIENNEQKKVETLLKISDTKIDSKKTVVKAEESPIESEKKEPKKKLPRYSDEDLVIFKERILVVRKEALEELVMLRERLEDLTNYDYAEESMIYSMHMAEQGSEALEKEKTYAQIQRINEYIKKLDDALERIKDKSYGICRVCGCLVAKARLMAVPITTLSASYKIQKKCPEDGIDKIEPLKK